MRLQRFGVLCGFVCGAVLSALVIGCGGGGGSTPAPPATLTITTTSPLTSGDVGTAYSTTLAASGGTAPYTWSATGLPAGLALSNGVISGTPTASGTSTVAISVKDSAATAQSANLSATLVINAALAITTTSPLPVGGINSAYSTTLAATGGAAPYTWSVTTGTLPAGLALTSAGVLSGTPTTAGTSTFTIQVADALLAKANLAATLVINGTLAITTTSLPAGQQGVPYSYTVAATGGVPPYTWSVDPSVPLPAGLAISAAGVLSGTPTGVASVTPDFVVMDSASHTVTKNLPIVINPATGTIPDGFYAFVFAGTAPQGKDNAANAVAINGTITVKSGAIQSGFFDENTNTGPAVVEQAITGGTLTNGTNGLGTLTLTTAGGTMTFALATPASVTPGGASPIRMIEFDDTTGTGSRGSGTLKPALPNPTTAAISGNFAFLFSGTDPTQNEQALAGAFATDGAGNITGGLADSNQAGTLKAFPTVQGTYSVDANGRGVFEVILANGGPSINTHFHYSFYQVSPSEWLAISLDTATTNSPLVSGSVLQQTGAGSFTTTSLPATSVLQIHGLAPITGGVTPDITAGFATSDGNGNVSYAFDEYSTAQTNGTFTVTYAVDAATGRAASTTNSSNPQPILYIIDSNSAFLLGPDASSSSGIIEAQTSTAFSGNYLGGSVPLVDTGVLNEAGIVAADGAGNVLITTNRSTQNGLTLYQNIPATYTVDAKGRVVVTITGDNTIRIFYVISPTRIAYLTSDGGGYLGSFAQ